MTVCAGLCSYSPRQGFCSIRLSVPLLKLRPRKDFVETLLHEMIHAYLFVTDGNDDHDGHGPAFHSHMHRINKAGLFFFDTFVGASAHFGVNFVIKNEHPLSFF